MPTVPFNRVIALLTRRRSRYNVGMMRKSFRGTFLKRGRWWVGWSADVPGALTQGRTLEEAKENLRDAVRLMLEDVDLSRVPKT